LQGVFASVHERIGRCTKCQFHAARPAKAPLLGHQMATRERITFIERTL
jgi:ribosomal protein L37AE/L43A